MACCRLNCTSLPLQFHVTTNFCTNCRPQRHALNATMSHTSFKETHYELSTSKSICSAKHSSSIKRYVPPLSKLKFLTRNLSTNTWHCPAIRCKCSFRSPRKNQSQSEEAAVSSTHLHCIHRSCEINIGRSCLKLSSPLRHIFVYLWMT